MEKIRVRNSSLDTSLALHWDLSCLSSALEIHTSFAFSECFTLPWIAWHERKREEKIISGHTLFWSPMMFIAPTAYFSCKAINFGDHNLLSLDFWRAKMHVCDSCVDTFKTFTWFVSNSLRIFQSFLEVVSRENRSSKRDSELFKGLLFHWKRLNPRLVVVKRELRPSTGRVGMDVVFEATNLPRPNMQGPWLRMCVMWCVFSVSDCDNLRGIDCLRGSSRRTNMTVTTAIGCGASR